MIVIDIEVSLTNINLIIIVNLLFSRINCNNFITTIFLFRREHITWSFNVWHEKLFVFYSAFVCLFGK